MKIQNRIKDKLRIVVDNLFPSFRTYRIFRSRNKQYGNLLISLGYENKKCDGEEEYIRFWNQLTKRVSTSEYRLFSKYMGPTTFIVPDYIGTEILAYYLNPHRYMDFYEDKNSYPIFIHSDNSYPKTLLYRMDGGQIVDETNCGFFKPYSEEGNNNDAAIADKVILKPTVDSCSGKDVLLFKYDGGVFRTSNGLVLDYNFLEKYNDDFVVQEAIEQHPYLAQFNPTSVNTLRICTYRSIETGEIKVTGALIRIGKQGEIVDNAHAGGRFVGVDLETGELQHKAMDQFGNCYSSWNNISFEDTYVVPCWSLIKEFSCKIASYIKHCRLLALDVTLDVNGAPRLIEVNISGFAYWVFQFVGQNVFVGETQSVIEYCKKKLIADGRIAAV